MIMGQKSAKVAADFECWNCSAAAADFLMDFSERVSLKSLQAWILKRKHWKPFGEITNILVG